MQNIKAAKKGDKKAFSWLFTEFYTPLVRFVSYRVKDNFLVEDIVSQVFLKWYESMEKYEVKQKPLNYLYMIATRLIINEGVRKKAEYFPENAEEFLPDSGPSIETILDQEINFEQIKKIIDTELSELEKNVVTLKYIEDMSNSEIANILEKEENYVRQIEFRALKKIRQKVETK